MADMKAYFQKIKAIEELIPEPYTVVASVATSDGGKEGLLTEVTRHQAAILVADGKARLANEEEVELHYKQVQVAILEQEKRVRAEQLRAALISKVLFKAETENEG
jgi:hypothetical protein